MQERFIYCEGEIYVFNSNLAGKHNNGSAYTAKKYYGAKVKKGTGFEGRSYAIPIRGRDMEILSLEKIQKYVRKFIEFVKENEDKKFFINFIGIELDRESQKEIAIQLSELKDFGNVRIHPELLKFVL